ncbi:MAG: sulfatase-like hydrolase/transferase, partial [Planctomycetota bacterium]|nr:sulfatase-like hydrolase/transferase [Planctomycetota bacterium]
TSILQGFTHGGRDFALRGSAKILEGFQQKRDAEKPFFLLLHTYEAHDPYGRDGHPWPKLPVHPGKRSDLDLDAVTEPWEITKHYFLDRKARLDLIERYGPAVTKQVIQYVHGGYRDEPRPDVAADLREGYEAGVAWVDTIVRATVEQLEAWGMLENTVLVITSDHGEAFGEHGILAHGRQLYDELVHVPMVLAGPAPFDGGRSIPGGVGLVDVLPTFLDYIGGAPLQGVQGRSFLGLLKGEDAGRPVFSEEIVNRDNTGEDLDQMLTSVRSARWKYLITFDRLAGTVIEEAYDLLEDPGEQSDLCAGTGRIEGIAFDPAFCAAVEQARDRIWGAAQQSERLYRSPYSGGSAQVTSKRPKACGK